uniref:Spondin-like TSP1 domain-containing protein n=1 Tax=Timema monikensis TaxID=170555 RepID=A0A7R9HP98_9NEOP|nr:unnamed protein product [Timema monikensis]
MVELHITKMTIMKWTFIALACLVHPQVGARTTDDNNLNTQKYQWKTGSWGTCYVAGGCGEGRRERQVRCSDPEGRTVLELMCDPITAPLKIKLCFTACRHHRDKLQWQVGAWGPCLPVSPAGLAAEATDIPERENLGVTQRNVTCVLVSHDAVKVHRIVDDDNCFTVARKPDPVRFCHIPKPQDCVVSQFSSWSLCDGCGDDVNNQTRVRVVIVAPMNGGKPCPELTEMRPCNPRMECLKKTSEIISDTPRYKLKVGEWRLCEAPTSMVSADTLESRVISHLGRDGGHGLYPPSIMYPASSGTSAEVIENYYTFQPQVGYQTREVSCRDPKGTIVDISLCLGEEHNNQHLPTRVRPCVVSQDCVVSQWSAWTRTQDGCVAVNGNVRAEIHQRKREVVRLQEGDGQLCPHLVELRQTTDKDQLQMCSSKYRWLASKWSPCVVTSDESSGPRLVEVGCGGGVQLRDVTCIATQSGKPVSHELCDSLEILPTVQRCEVACPRDCEVGTWGVWGPCKPIECPEYGDTLPQGYRERRRTIEVMSSEQGVDCPSIKEVQTCPQPTCYTWVEGLWTPCYLDPQVKRCGEGRKTRTVSCRSTLYGNIVDDSLCTRRQVKPLTEESCLLPCPFDCVLSPWSEWSPCSHSCSSLRQAALRQRNRTVIAPPGPGGHGCPDPDEMLQIEPCNTHSCHGYSWFTLPWQPCQVFHSTTNITTNTTSLPQFPPELELDLLGGDPEDVGDTKEDEEEEDAVYNSTVATCGDGEQEREVWCLEANDQRVPDWKCQPLPKPTTTRSCTRICPVNCRMSPWSEWSTCPQQCVPDSSVEVRDGEVTPTQSRRRVVIQWPANGGLPCQNLEELRPCPLSGARCKHYLWGIGPWSDCQLPANVECGMGYRTREDSCWNKKMFGGKR